MAKREPSENDLSNEDVKRLVYSYQDAEVSDELLSFGQTLLESGKFRGEGLCSFRGGR